ncbi:UDP-N-acetylmuramate dehydrogenase [uncultured Paludibaculum sp.]|uniref:UDP-N-acetylmuramate dehydrogenase n=1 Tax=uncultured Paludibaculum sp. TaxID=1765020 RepID=UPI002AAA6700|nr:UDP-N-acetylmuramate dehydrogenase [uncultured Paludibaculum sp.]
MLSAQEAHERLSLVPSLQISRKEPLARHTRFGLGGPASLFVDSEDEAAFLQALRIAKESGLPHLVIGLGTNLVVADKGYDGIVLRYRGGAISVEGTLVSVQAGAALQDLVDFTTAHGLRGIESMTGIPGNVGAAIYGNAGAYGASISDVVERVRYFDGQVVCETGKAGCEFRYRGSIFKQNRLSGRPWLVLSAWLRFAEGDAAELQKTAAGILAIRNQKYPPDMKCAGSIFKNLILAELPSEARVQVPENVVKGGKVPSAWFLDQVGARGLSDGGIRVADYHANTIFNAGDGTAAQVRRLVAELKGRVHERFGIDLEEEVQYIGFDSSS